jgi:hypothetical protein
VTRGSDQVAISTKFDVRVEESVVSNFGQLLVEAAATVPDGIVCFFTRHARGRERHWKGSDARAATRTWRR